MNLSCSLCQRHSFYGKLLALGSDDSRRGANSELPVCKDIRHRVIRIIFEPNR